MADRYDYIQNLYRKLTGGLYVGFNNSVYLSEREAADRNFALGHYMMGKGFFCLLLFICNPNFAIRISDSEKISKYFDMNDLKNPQKIIVFRPIQI